MTVRRNFVKSARISCILLFLSTFLVVGCSSTWLNWQEAKFSNTVDAYTDYLAKHPQGPHADDARAAIDDLEWDSAKNYASLSYPLPLDKESIEAFNGYILKFPQGRHVVEAKEGIEQLDWKAADSSGKITDYMGYLSKYPRGKYADRAKEEINYFYVTIFHSEDPIKIQPIGATGKIEFHNWTPPIARLKLAEGEFEILMDTLGRELARRMDGKTVEVHGSLTGKAFYDMVVSSNYNSAGTYDVNRIPELKVADYKETH